MQFSEERSFTKYAKHTCVNDLHVHMTRVIASSHDAATIAHNNLYERSWPLSLRSDWWNDGVE